ncbi:MAG: efflux RND transporter periplasmic adaptor subunit [Rikenellaceae bacterium]
MNKLKIVQVLGIIAIALTAYSCGESAPQQQAPKSYKTITIAKSNASVSNKYTASIRGEHYVDIRPQVSGVITKIAIEEGADVKKGQTLFIIDQVPYQAALDVATANVNSAASMVATAKLNAESGKSLYDEQVISYNELQVLENELASAEASLLLAQAQQKSAKNDLSYTVVKSPVDGVASMINYRIGALVSSSITEPLVSVSHNDRMYVYFSLSESALLNLIQQSGSQDSMLKDMQDVELILNNGSVYSHKGTVDAISGVIEQGTGSVRARAIFDNPEGLLRDGGNGSLSITTSYQDVIVVPKVATFEIQNKTFVYKVIDNKTKSAEIAIVQGDNGNEFIVESGLSVGDEIIAEGAGLLREDTVVKAN